jgi:selenide,water dikinase
LNPALLDEALRTIDFPTNSNVLVDASHADDAGIIQIDKEFALVQTTDFFTPIVDDPYIYGQIAAANALSDIYAMGAEPISALNIICFPDTVLDSEAFKLILQGGAEKAKEAGIVILGGHSVSDKELKYGLAVTGKIHPKKIKLNHNLKSGDYLILTKPIGTGILTTALKNGILNEDDISSAIKSMLTLNDKPSKLLHKYPVSACTDVTGYGILGHLWEMLEGSEVGVTISVNEIPFFDNAIPFAKKGTQIPGGTLSNERFIHKHLDMGKVDLWYQALLFDPQTSGGLLISIPSEFATDFLNDLAEYPLPVSIIGEVHDRDNQISLV